MYTYYSRLLQLFLCNKIFIDVMCCFIISSQALVKADNLLSIKHGLTRLDNVWGVGGSLRPVQYLVRQMNMLLDEYLCSGDLQEAIRCILELEVPHFHHELVYEVCIIYLTSFS